MIKSPNDNIMYQVNKSVLNSPIQTQPVFVLLTAYCVYITIVFWLKKAWIEFGVQP